MYYFTSRVRFSEVSEDGCLSVQSLIDYYQDCSTFQSEDLGLGVDYLRKMNLIWVLSSWQIEMNHMPRLGDRILVGTLPYEFKGFLGMRNFWLENEKGQRLSCANSLWSLLDTETGHPVRIPEEMISGYDPGDKISMEYLPRKIQIGRESEEGETVVIHKHHLDTNHHVNNGQYVRIALESLGKAYDIKRLRVEYRKQVYLGDVLVPCISWEGKKGVVVLKDTDGNACCVVELTVR